MRLGLLALPILATMLASCATHEAIPVSLPSMAASAIPAASALPAEQPAALPQALREAMAQAQIYVEMVTPYRSSPLANRVERASGAYLSQQASAAGRDDMLASGRHPGAMYRCSRGGKRGTLVLRDDVDYTRDLIAGAVLVHEAVHHGQCEAGIAFDPCHWEGEAYLVQTQFLREAIGLLRNANPQSLNVGTAATLASLSEATRFSYIRTLEAAASEAEDQAAEACFWSPGPH